LCAAMQNPAVPVRDSSTATSRLNIRTGQGAARRRTYDDRSHLLLTSIDDFQSGLGSQA
jgi:hypothetical protein